MQALEQEIRRFIVEALALEDISPDEIPADMPLFAQGLGLDSIDALDLALALEKRYGVAMPPDPAQTERHFSSVQALARFVAAARLR